MLTLASAMMVLGMMAKILTLFIDGAAYLVAGVAALYGGIKESRKLLFTSSIVVLVYGVVLIAIHAVNANITGIQIASVLLGMAALLFVASRRARF